ncbi:unnamed protein product, partial [Bubo scandiacus]
MLPSSHSYTDSAFTACQLHAAGTQLKGGPGGWCRAPQRECTLPSGCHDHPTHPSGQDPKIHWQGLHPLVIMAPRPHSQLPHYLLSGNTGTATFRWGQSTVSTAFGTPMSPTWSPYNL